MTTFRIQQVLTLMVGMLGLFVAVARLTANDAMLYFVPEPSGISFVSALLFLVAAACLWPSAPAPSRPGLASLRPWGAALLVVAPAAIVLQQLADLDLGLDFSSLHRMRDNGMLPGRPPISTCLGLLGTGLALWMLQRPALGKGGRALVLLSVYGVLALGWSALLANILKLYVLYQIPAQAQMAASTAIAMSLTGLALWLHLRRKLRGQVRREAASPDQHITRTAVLVLAVVGIITGLAGFVVLKQAFEQSTSDTFQRSAKNNAATFASTLDQQIGLNAVIAARPGLRNIMLRLDADPTEQNSRVLLEQAISTFLPSGVSSVQILDAKGRLLASAGSMLRKSATSSLPLQHPQERAFLLWKDGFVLWTESAMTANGRNIGTLVTEQPLPVLTALVREIEKESASSDIVICGREQHDAVCFPSRFYSANLRVPLLDDGQPRYALARAVLGQTGALTLRDLRGVPVLAGYAPIGNTGLGLVYKADTSELYSPIRYRLNILFGLLAMLVAAGTFLLRSQVHPLARQLVAKQQRMQSMLSGTQEAFIEIDRNGLIIDWNAEAEHTFGWKRHEVLGRALTEVVIPPALREMHERGMARFLMHGEGPVLGKRIELPALHRDGREFPVEATISAIENDQGYTFMAFLHDISSRKAAEEKLVGSERRLHAVTDNLPVLIAYIDTEHRFKFANGTFETWLGIKPEQIIGTHARAILGERNYAEQLPYLERALAGNRVEFEIDSAMKGGTRNLRNTFIPDTGPDGSVAGVYAMSTDVTALVHSERRIRTITDNMPARIAYIDADQRFRFCNGLYQTIAGLDADNMLGRTMCEVFGDDVYRLLEPQVKKVLRGERVFFERLAQKRGVSKYLEYSYIPEIDADGKVLGFYSMVTDVTARKNAELAREKDHELLEAILETVDVGVVACDEHGTLSLFNRATREFHGLPQHRLAPEEWAQYYNLYYADGHTPMAMQDIPLYRALRGEQGNLDEMVIVSAGGVARRVACSGRQLKGKKGENLGAVVVLSDITERRRIQDSLLASESRLRRLMNSSLIGIIQSDEQGFLTEANDVFFQFSGYGRDALGGGRLNWSEMTSPRFHERQQQALAELREQGTATPFESELIRSDGSLAPIFVGMAHLEGSDREWVSFVLDLTEQRRLDRIKSEFISVVSHELRTPLTSIRGSLGLLQGGVLGQLPPKAMDLVKIAHKNSERLVGLVNDILDLEKLAAGAVDFDMRRLDLVALASQSIEANAAYAQAYQVKYVLCEHPGHAWVLGDSGRLMQAMANLLSNAAKFSPRGGQVSIRILQNEHGVRLEVEDHGAGIPEAFRDRIFGKFAQAESNDTRQQGGTGLGLNITKTLIEKMGGEIGFETGNGRGTVFWFVLRTGERRLDAGTEGGESKPLLTQS